MIRLQFIKIKCCCQMFYELQDTILGSCVCWSGLSWLFTAC